MNQQEFPLSAGDSLLVPEQSQWVNSVIQLPAYSDISCKRAVITLHMVSSSAGTSGREMRGLLPCLWFKTLSGRDPEHHKPNQA